MRIISLVPSLTLSLFELGHDASSIVGRTPWCIHPSQQVKQIPIIGGTKTPTLSKIKRLNPDLIVMDRDENPKAVYDWCNEEGIETFVCDVGHPHDVPTMLRDLGMATQQQKNSETFANRLETLLDSFADQSPLEATTVLPLIWHQPLMAANANTYAGGMLSTLGLHIPTIEPQSTRYPEVHPHQLYELSVEGLLLSSEPHEFAVEEGEAIAAQTFEQFGHEMWCKCIDGEALTWMGTRTESALEQLAVELKTI